MLETLKNKNETFENEKRALEDEMNSFAVKVAADVFNRQKAERKKQEPPPLITLENILADAKVGIFTYEGMPVDQVEEDAVICEWIDGSPDHSYIVAEAIDPEIRIKGKIVRRAKLSCYKTYEKAAETVIIDKGDNADTGNAEVVIIDETTQPDNTSAGIVQNDNIETTKQISVIANQSELNENRKEEIGKKIEPRQEDIAQQQEEKINGSEKYGQKDEKNLETPTDSADVIGGTAVASKPEKPGLFSWIKKIFGGNSDINIKEKEEINFPELTDETQKDENLPDKDERAAETETEIISTVSTPVKVSGNLETVLLEESASVDEQKDEAGNSATEVDAVQKDEAPADDSGTAETENPEEAANVKDRKEKSGKTAKDEHAVQKDETPGENLGDIETLKPKQVESAEDRKEESEKPMKDEDAFQTDITPADNSINREAGEFDEVKDTEEQSKEINQISGTEKETIQTDSTFGKATSSIDSSHLKQDTEKPLAKQSRKQKKKEQMSKTAQNNKKQY